MKKFPALVLSMLSVSAVFSGSFAIAEPAVQPQSASFQKQVGYLFVITTPSAQLKQIDQLSYRLSIPASDIRTVLAFSDRPERIVKHLSPADYVKMVDSGNDSFIKNPPNVAVVLGTSAPVIFEVVKVTKDNNEVVYDLSLLANQQAPMGSTGPATLYIDPSWSGGGDFPIG